MTGERKCRQGSRSRSCGAGQVMRDGIPAAGARASRASSFTMSPQHIVKMEESETENNQR